MVRNQDKSITEGKWNEIKSAEIASYIYIWSHDLGQKYPIITQWEKYSFLNGAG